MRHSIIAWQHIIESKLQSFYRLNCYYDIWSETKQMFISIKKILRGVGFNWACALPPLSTSHSAAAYQTVHLWGHRIHYWCSISATQLWNTPAISVDKYAQKEIIKQPGPAWLAQSARVQQQSSPCVYKIPRINRRNQRQIPAERNGSLVKNQVTGVKLIVWQSCLTPHVRPGLMDYQHADNHSHKCAGQPERTATVAADTATLVANILISTCRINHRQPT